MFQVLFQGKIVSREKIENNIYAKFCGENKLHYGERESRKWRTSK